MRFCRDDVEPEAEAEPEAAFEELELIRGGLYGTMRISSTPLPRGAPGFISRGSRLGRGGEGDMLSTFTRQERS